MVNGLSDVVSGYRSLDRKTRVLITASASFLLNAAVGAGKILLGLIFLSPWYIINGVYYLILCIAKGFSLRRFIFGTADGNIFRKSGVFLLALGFSYLLISIRMFFRSDATHFPDYIVYPVVIISLLKLCFGVRGVFYSNMEKSDSVKVVRIYSMADAGVSLVVTRCSLLLITNAPDAVSNSAVFGIIVSIGIMLTGSIMCLGRCR